MLMIIKTGFQELGDPDVRLDINDIKELVTFFIRIPSHA